MAAGGVARCMVEVVFLEVAMVLAIAAAAGLVAVLVRQPLIVAFLVVGILVGPVGFHLIGDEAPYALLARLGIALLLFTVGLKLDPRLLKTIGPVALYAGIGQILFTSVIGFFLARAFAFGVLESVYVAVALTFSSTIIIVKLLTEKRELETLHGRVAVGVLIVQDIFVVIVLMVLSVLGGRGATAADVGLWGVAGPVLVSLASGVGLLGAVMLLMRFVFPRLLRMLARSHELVTLFAVGWGIGLAALAEVLGLSAELGAFIAGVGLAASEYREAIGSRLVGLRDFLLLFFFIVLGSSLDLAGMRAQVVPAFVFSAFVLVGNPLIVMVILGVLGFRRRTGFLCGLTVAQISEFSLVLGAMGLALGHIAGATMGLITLVGLITIVTSTYLILNSLSLYERLHPLLRPFERGAPWREEVAGQKPAADGGKARSPVEVVVFGLGRYGMALATRLREGGLRVLGVDVDPEAVSRARAAGLDAMYGDAADAEFPLHMPLGEARLVVSTLSDVRAGRVLAHGLASARFDGVFLLTAHRDQEARILEEEGFEVVRPFHDAGEAVAAVIFKRLRAGGGGQLGPRVTDD